MLLVVVFILEIRDKRSFHGLVDQIFPFEMSKPRMFNQLMCSIMPESLGPFPAQAAVNEVNYVRIPVVDALLRFQFELSLLIFILQFLPISALIRPPVEHQLKGYDTNSIKVNFITVILLKKYLRCHVTWCPDELLRVLLFIRLSNTEVSYLEIAFLIKHEIFWLDIFVDYVF